MSRTHWPVLLLLGLGTTAVSAQPEPPSSDVVFFNVAAAPAIAFAGPIDIMGMAGAVPGAVVKGKPYTADSVTESAQVLADGNRIVQRNAARVSRDSQGRTRLEQTLGGVGAGGAANEAVTIVNINDPVAEVAYVLDPQRRTAQQRRPLKIAFGAGAGRPPAGGVAVGQAGPGAEQRLQVFVNGAGPGDPVDLPPPLAVPPAGMAAGVFTTRMFASATAGTKVVSEDLGDQVIEGLLAHGTRNTQTIPAGAIGNERPIEIVAEQWYSRDIEAIVLRRNVDPRFGETTYKLVNVDRGEPAQDLFQVPQGYTLETAREPSFAPATRRFRDAVEPAPPSN